MQTMVLITLRATVIDGITHWAEVLVTAYAQTSILTAHKVYE